MTIRVRLYEDSRAFLAETEEFLLQDEVVNSLILGATAAVARQTINRHRFRPIFALLEEQGTVRAVIVWTLPKKPILSADPTVSDEGLRHLIQHLNRNRAYPDIVFGPADVAQRLADLWAQAQGLQVQEGMRQRLFALHEVDWPNPVADGSMHAATYWNRDMLSDWIRAFQAEAVPDDLVDPETALLIVDRLLTDENIYLWLAETAGQELQPVAMAARARPTHNSIAVNLVYTPPAFRRRGYASALVASLSQQLITDGWQFCTLFTDLSNPTSNHIYETIGYRPLRDFTEFRLMSAKLNI